MIDPHVEGPPRLFGIDGFRPPVADAVIPDGLPGDGVIHVHVIVIDKRRRIRRKRLF